MDEPTGGLVLQQKWEDLAAYIFAAVLRGMPKEERFSLGADIRGLIWEVESALAQLSIRSGNRWAQLDLVDSRAKVLQGMIRVGIRVGAIPQKRYEPVSEKLVEIGRIVGGLKKRR